MTRLHRVAIVTAVLFAALIGVSFATGLVTVYDGPANAGIVVGVPCHNIGWEFRGTPGRITDTCE